MDADQARAMVERIHQAFDLFDAGVSIKRAQLHRIHPDASESDLARMVKAWLSAQPGAERRCPQRASTPRPGPRMNDLESATRHIVDALDTAGVEAAVAGGLAVSARVEPRFTRDLDLCVVVADDSMAEWLVGRLRDRGYELQALLEQEAKSRIAAVRLAGPADGGVGVDLLFASSGVEAEVVASAEVIELFVGLPARVATVGSLIALKVLSRDDASRPQDRVDLLALLRAAAPVDLEEAERLCGLIGSRGFARGRDLQGSLRAIQRESTA